MISNTLIFLRRALPHVFALLVLGSGGTAALAAADPLSAEDQVRAMRRGVNIVGYDPLWVDPAKARFKPRHLKLIKEAGFDAVRMVLGAFRFMNEKHELPASWFATLDALVQEALAQKLTVILDEHDYNFCGRDADACRVRLLAFWSQVADHYKDAPSAVVFEILNEPNKAMDARWNAIAAEALALIRKTNPNRNAIIGPGFWNNIGWLPKLELPQADRHIIVTVHYYLPMRFTHQGASWTPEYVALTRVTWGTPEDHAAIDRDFDGVQAWAKEHQRPILLGEFGAYDKAPIDSRVKYTSAVARAAEKRGWAWAYWQFDSDFVVYLIDEDKWNEPILKALIPPT
jgi:endoglucanase